MGTLFSIILKDRVFRVSSINQSHICLYKETERRTRLCLAASNSFYLGPDLDPDLDLDLDLDPDPDLDLDLDPDLDPDPNLGHFQFWSFSILVIFCFGNFLLW